MKASLQAAPSTMTLEDENVELREMGAALGVWGLEGLWSSELFGL